MQKHYHIRINYILLWYLYLLWMHCVNIHLFKIRYWYLTYWYVINLLMTTYIWSCLNNFPLPKPNPCTLWTVHPQVNIRRNWVLCINDKLEHLLVLKLIKVSRPIIGTYWYVLLMYHNHLFLFNMPFDYLTSDILWWPYIFKFKLLYYSNIPIYQSVRYINVSTNHNSNINFQA